LKTHSATCKQREKFIEKCPENTEDGYQDQGRLLEEGQKEVGLWMVWGLPISSAPLYIWLMGPSVLQN
jgi:hypothetical protein